jgi:hypothetical protein
MGKNNINIGLENALIMRIIQYFTLCGQNVEFLIVKAVVHIVTTGFKGLNL